MRSSGIRCRRAGGVFLVAVASLLAGCATQPQSLYYWGQYQPSVLGHLLREKSPQQQIQVLEKDIEVARSLNQSLPPGFRAHLGILYAEDGKLDRTRVLLADEKKAFPEGAGFMEFLLKKFEP